jgi:prophage DNA circulation protein
MNQAEKDAALRRLMLANEVFRDLRVSVEDAAEMAKQTNSSALAFAAFHLSDSLRAYAHEMTKYVLEVINE